MIEALCTDNCLAFHSNIRGSYGHGVWTPANPLVLDLRRPDAASGAARPNSTTGSSFGADPAYTLPIPASHRTVLAVGTVWLWVAYPHELKIYVRD